MRPMRWVFAGLVLSLIVSDAAFAQDKPPAPPAVPTPPPKPLTPEQAADEVVAAFQAEDTAALKALAAKDAPDPWLVADELCARDQFDAADACAKAAPRKDTERLADYVASRRKVGYAAESRKALDAANAALGAKKWADALASLDASRRQDDDVVAVRLRFGRGVALRGLARLGESAVAFREAADAAERLGWNARASTALHESGWSAYSRGDFRSALDAWTRRLDLDEARGDRAGAARALGNLGFVHEMLGQFAKAIDVEERALQRMEELGDRAGAAATLGNLGVVHAKCGDFSKALHFQERALTLKEELGDREGAAATLGNLGMVHQNLGDFAKALAIQERALARKEAIGDRPGVAATVQNIGLIHQSLGNYAKALEYLERSRELMEKLGYRAGVASALATIGEVHRWRGDYAKALDCHVRARTMAQEQGDRAAVARTLGGIALVHESLGDYARALDDLTKALEQMEELGDRPGAAATLGNIGILHTRLGDYAQALEFQERALRLHEEIGDRVGVATALGNVGAIHSSRNDPRGALDFHERALELKQGLGDRWGAARELAAVGRAHHALGEPAKALDFLQRARASAEEIGALDTVVGILWAEAGIHRAAGRAREALDCARLAVELMPRLVRGVAEEQGASARQRRGGAFDVGIAAAVDAGDADAALFFVESGRAGALLESMRSREAIASVSLPPALAESERAARARETAATAALRRALARGDLGVIHDARAALAAAQTEVLDAVAHIQRDAKAVASVVYPTADSAEAVRGRLLDDEALVLFAMHGDDAGGTTALVVTAKAVRIVPLGETGDVEAACAALRAYDADADPAAAIGTLRKLLLDPLQIDKKTTRLLVSPDGALSYLPFALLAPETAIAYVPSGTTYGVLRDDASKKGEAVLALGDPDYGVESAPQDTAVAMRGGMQLVRLPATGAEAKAVGDVVLLGKDATEQGLRDALATRPRWRAVHLACHGLVDPERPMFSSLALTPSGEDDGFLTALEVFRMKVPADLVVLSACETGKGKVYRAEGIVGLTRAFMFAGAPRVLVSLWKVDDEATRALMTKFYEAWKKGVPAARALREAQVFVRGHEKWKHPRFWAAWMLWGLPE